MRVFRALTHRSFALLWTGQTISRLGDGCYTIAVAWWVVVHTGSAAAMGVVLVFSSVPRLLFVLVGGVVVDRVSGLRLMRFADITRGSICGLIAVLTATDHLTLLYLAAVSALFGLVGAFFSPAYAAALPEVAPMDALPSANALRNLSAQVGNILGPAVGGALVAFGGTAFAFGLDGITFAVSAACLAAITASAPARSQLSAHPFHAVIEGFTTVRASPWLWVTITISGASTLLLYGPLSAVLPLRLERDLGLPVVAFATVNTLCAVGAFIAAVLMGRPTRLRKRGLLVYGPMMLAGGAVAAIGLPVPLAVIATALFVFGAAEAVFILAWVQSLQEIVPPAQLGRVASIDELGSDALLPIGFGLAGIAADHLGTAPVFLLGGTLGAAIISLGLLHPMVRRMD